MSLETRVSISEAELLVKNAFLKNGVKEDIAASVSTALVAAEAEGQVGHGFSRVKDYIAQVKSKKINVDAKIKIEHPKPTSISVDADYGFAYPALDQAISEGALVAKEYGSAVVSVFNSHHCGALSVQVEKIANHGLIGLMMANTPKAIAPWGVKIHFWYQSNSFCSSTNRKRSVSYRLIFIKGCTRENNACEKGKCYDTRGVGVG